MIFQGSIILLRYFSRVLCLRSRSWDVFHLVNCLCNLFLKLIDFIYFLWPMVWFSLLSFFLIIFFSGACTTKTLQKSRRKVIKLKSASIFSAYYNNVSVNGVHTKILEISEFDSTVISGDIIFLKILKDNVLWKMIWNETCYCITFVLVMIYEYIVKKRWFLSHSYKKVIWSVIWRVICLVQQ